MKLEIGTQRVRRGQVQFFVVGGGDRTDAMVTFDGQGFRSNGGPVDWDEIENADEAAEFGKRLLAQD